MWNEILKKQAEGRMYRGLPKFDNPPPPPVKKLINMKVDETTAALEKLAEKFIQMDKAVRRARLARRLEFIEIPWMGSIDLPMSKGPHMITGNIYRIIFSLEGLDIDEKVTLASNVALDFIHRKIDLMA